jgi:hypothetical protein|tara:strand:- start:657 stop:1682 length:1026 start_codon:yes stop_codon:yes gene_type:complete
MSQIIIYDASEMNALLGERRRGWTRTVRALEPKFNRLRAEIYSTAYDESRNNLSTNVATFLAHHQSGNPFIKRLHRSHQMTNTQWNEIIEKALITITDLYLKKVIGGDLVIHKTHSNVRYESEQWPIIRKRRTKYEAWFITGMTQWIEELLSFAQHQNTAQQLQQWDSVRKMEWLREQSKMPAIILKKPRDNNNINILFKRAHWVWAARKYHNAILWSELIWNSVPRAGICLYINGRAYCVQYGKQLANFKIYQRASRYNAQEIGLPLAPWVQNYKKNPLAPKDDPDFVKRFMWWREQRMLGRADENCNPADMWVDEESPFSEAMESAMRRFHRADDQDEE